MSLDNQPIILRVPGLIREVIRDDSKAYLEMVAHMSADKMWRHASRNIPRWNSNADLPNPETLRSILSIIAYKNEQLGISYGDLLRWLRQRETPVLGEPNDRRLIKAIPTPPITLIQ